MITYTKENGCYFVRETTEKHYHLYEAVTFKGHTTSDRIIIWDEDADKMVNFVYGANSISVEELDQMVSAYVEEYEAKKARKTPASIVYRFTKDGVRLFLEDALDDVLDAVDKGRDNLDYVVSVGHRSIHLPDLAEIYEGLQDWLEESLKEAEI